MKPAPSCPDCQGTQVRRHGVTDRGVQKYVCMNANCPRTGFLAAYQESPYVSQAAYMRAYRTRKAEERAAVKAATQIGDATLWQADCLALLQSGLIPAHSVDLILADLPYGKTACGWDTPLPLPVLWTAYKRLLTPGGAVVLTAAEGFDLTLAQSNPPWYRYKFIWRKHNIANPMLVTKQPGRVHEYVVVFCRGQTTYHPQMTTGHKPIAGFRDDTKSLGEIYMGSTRGRTRLISTHRDNPEGTRYPTSVWEIPVDTIWDIPQERANVHPTAKPVELMLRLILTYSNAGETVLDNTMGSGTTGLACLQTGRQFLGIELQPAYFATACERIRAALREREEQARQGDLFAAD
jgi:site-specific DNA-methyltransferase (adenine-specific)